MLKKDIVAAWFKHRELELQFVPEFDEWCYQKTFADFHDWPSDEWHELFLNQPDMPSQNFDLFKLTPNDEPLNDEEREYILKMYLQIL